MNETLFRKHRAERARKQCLTHHESLDALSIGILKHKYTTMLKFSYLSSSNADYIDELLEKYSKDPESVDPTWRFFFEGLEFGASELAPASGEPNGAAEVSASTLDHQAEVKVAELIHAYRDEGKTIATIDPLTPPASSSPMLDLTRFGLTAADLEKTFASGRMIGIGQAKLKDIIARLKSVYCGTIGAELSHITNPDERKWIQDKFEAQATVPTPDTETRKFIIKRLTESETFERFLHTRYVAQKRFSVEGGESTIPALDCIIEVGAQLGATDFVLGMAHRGRLNVLVNVFGKKYEQIFTQFEGAYKLPADSGEGDVKYHMGYSRDFVTRDKKNVHLSMASNPSHLEFVAAVVQGVARAKQDTSGDTQRTKVVPIAIHGDAALAGQGVCYETIAMSQLEGYTTGGTIHIVINNQVGFTTSPKDARSTGYSTDLAKMLETPIFHVNGDDPEAVWWVSKLAIEYRQKFRKDVFIDLVCYRKHGHNEGDEPSFTQPLLYKKIKAHPSTREIYAKKLAGAGVLTEDQSKLLVEEVTKLMTEAQTRTKAEAPAPFISALEGRWQGLKRGTEEDCFKAVKTAVSEKTLLELATKINALPSGFHLHPKLNRFFEARMRAVQEGRGIDWGNGESLAYASLVNEGIPVRLSGQDAERGTFTHRHSVLNDFETGEAYVPLNRIREGQAAFRVHNSLLSETAVMGFDYGYSLADPKSLVLWEAQFGDFANGAQVIIDQFLASSESKWQRMSGLVLLLPHGYEGQGPEHSSARLERFLQLCGRNNMTVANFTTPAQFFHALRRQIVRDFRKPMVVMTPKSLLRHPQAVSTLSDFSQGTFEEVIPDTNVKKAKRILLCSGKVYYDLLAARDERKAADTAIVRVEQLYPWPAAKLAAILEQHSSAEIVWTQEEPRNMGAWSYVFNLWNGGTGEFAKQVGSRTIRYAGREIAAAPAVGSAKVHEVQQKTLIEEALR
jgi:2-oxoglutarate dehydrogenase E1 component